jgi:hypothetical protein
MPEYLAPGVYVEEVSFRAKSIEGVSTSVAGFIGPTRYGPVGDTPELLTSFADFSRIYGGIDNLSFAGQDESQINYMAHAVRAFFDNGGRMLYVTRVYQYDVAENTDPDETTGKSVLALGTTPEVTLRARFPGTTGDMRIVFAVNTSSNLLASVGGTTTVNSIKANDVVYIKSSNDSPESGLYNVQQGDSGMEFNNSTLTEPVAATALDLAQHRVHKVTISVRVLRDGRFEDEQVWSDMDPAPGSRNALTNIFATEPPSRRQHLVIPFAIETTITTGAAMVEALVGSTVMDAVDRHLSTNAELQAESETRPTLQELENTRTLASGSDGQLPTADTYAGEADAPIQTGLFTFEDIEEISMVAAPGSSVGYTDNATRVEAIVQHLLIHCQIRMRYRVAVIDSPANQVLSEVRDFRGKFDSTHAALNYPWITVVDPLDPEGRREINLPPSGFACGIYARTDVLYGVSKAPANEVVFGAVNFERLLNKAQQDVLNPLGINCFRFFEGRGFRLWGARTISSDPESQYLNVRRFLCYVEHSIDQGTQWAVFENNNETLWNRVRRTVEDFLFNEWRNGALLGTKPESAFFVRCDRSTMTQNDLDNGRLICLIGVAVVKPAEYVIFRIGQMTSGSNT